MAYSFNTLYIVLIILIKHSVKRRKEGSLKEMIHMCQRKCYKLKYYSYSVLRAFKHHKQKRISLKVILKLLFHFPTGDLLSRRVVWSLLHGKHRTFLFTKLVRKYDLQYKERIIYFFCLRKMLNQINRICSVCSPNRFAVLRRSFRKCC